MILILVMNYVVDFTDELLFVYTILTEFDSS